MVSLSPGIQVISNILNISIFLSQLQRRRLNLQGFPSDRSVVIIDVGVSERPRICRALAQDGGQPSRKTSRMLQVLGLEPECQDGTRIEIEFSLMANGLNQLYLHSNPDQLSSKLAGW